MSTAAEKIDAPLKNECHVLAFTGSMCGKFKGLPEDWPKNIDHTSLDEWEKSTCSTCRTSAKNHSHR